MTEDDLLQQALVAQDVLRERGWFVTVRDLRPYRDEGGEVELTVFAPEPDRGLGEREIVGFIRSSTDGTQQWFVHQRHVEEDPDGTGDYDAPLAYVDAVEAALAFDAAVREGKIVGWWLEQKVRAPNPRKLKARLLR